MTDMSHDMSNDRPQLRVDGRHQQTVKHICYFFTGVFDHHYRPYCGGSCHLDHSAGGDCDLLCPHQTNHSEEEEGHVPVL